MSSIIIVAEDAPSGARLAAALSCVGEGSTTGFIDRTKSERHFVSFDNKYYTASVPVTVITAQSGGLDVEKTVTSAVGKKPKCVALVGNWRAGARDDPVGRGPSNVVMDCVKQIAEHVCPEATALVPSIQNGMLESDKAQSASKTLMMKEPKLSAAEEDRLTEWCKTNGAELIAADVSDLASVLQTSREREKVGVARLHELLETVMWPSMELKSKPHGSALLSVPKEKSCEDGTSEATSTTSSSTTASNVSKPDARPCCGIFSFGNIEDGNGSGSSATLAGERFAEQSAESLAAFNLYDRGDILDVDDEEFRVPSKSTKLPQLSSKGRAFAFKISNKYYDATVRLLAKTLDVNDAEDDGANALARDLNAERCQALVGVVSVASVLSSESYLGRMQRALKIIKSATGVTTSILMLEGTCQYVSGGQQGTQLVSAISEDLRSSIRTWCIQAGVEMIEADSRRCTQEEANGVPPLLFSQTNREKVGYARLREALDAVAWDNCVMKNGSSRATKEDITRVVASPVETPALLPDAPPVSATSSTNGDLTHNNNKEEKSLQQSVEMKITSLEDRPKNGEKGEPDAFWDAMMSAASINGEAGGEDVDTDTFSRLISQARAVRQAGDAGTMSDTERQEAALKVAMQMASLMGIDEDDP